MANAPASGGASSPATKTAEADLELQKATEAEAKKRAEEEAAARLAEEEEAAGIMDSGEPIRCVCLKKFFDERGATIVPGETYYYTPKDGQPFPAELLEPTNQVLAGAVKKQYAAYEAAKAEAAAQRAQARDRMVKLFAGEE